MSKKEKSSSKGRPDSPMESLEIGSALYTTRLTNKFKNRKSWERPDVKKIEAIIPGSIQKIMVKEGDQVTAGTPLLILEAMKMRNEVLAPFSGVIGKIYVREGEMVHKPNLLIVMD
jgi:biotin carboxyl carrier protein